MSYFEQCLGASYSPGAYGQHEGAHPQRVREAMAALKGRPEADVIAALVHRCETQQLWLERANERPGPGSSADDAHAMRIALENCRMLAVRHRGIDWAGHILRFCEQVGVKGSVLRQAEDANDHSERQRV